MITIVADCIAFSCTFKLLADSEVTNGRFAEQFNLCR